MRIEMYLVFIISIFILGANHIHGQIAIIEEEILPGQVEIVLKEESLGDFNREGILKGETVTGLASLDSLNQAEGMIRIIPLSTNPKETLLGPKLRYTLFFDATADIERLVMAYKQNEHIADAWPDVLIPILTHTSMNSWGKIKMRIE